MITARYLIDIVSGAIDDLTSLYEAESVLLESLFYNSFLVSEDDIRRIKDLDSSLIYHGPSIRFVSEESVFNKTWAYQNGRCYLWSKSYDGFNKLYKKSDYVLVSEVEGLNLFNVSSQLIKNIKLIDKNDFCNQLKEFQKLKRNSNRLDLVIAPLGNKSSIEMLSKIK